MKTTVPTVYTQEKLQTVERNLSRRVARSVSDRLPVEGGSFFIYNSNISTDTTEHPTKNTPQLTPYHQRAAFTLGDNVKRFVQHAGIENCAFLTLTFADNVTDHREASRRFNSLNTHFLSRFYGRWLWVRERQKRGAWHYHIIIECKGDIRTGFDWAEYLQWLTDYSNGKKRRLKTGNPLLRSLWNLSSRAMQNYGFGRTELLPIRSTEDAVVKYVGKYIEKQIGQRADEDRGVRLTSTSRDFISSSPKFSWNTDGAKKWRQNLALFAQIACGCSDHDDFLQRAPHRWAHRYRNEIMEYDQHVFENLPDAPF